MAVAVDGVMIALGEMSRRWPATHVNVTAAPAKFFAMTGTKEIATADGLKRVLWGQGLPVARPAPDTTVAVEWGSCPKRPIAPRTSPAFHLATIGEWHTASEPALYAVEIAIVRAASGSST